MSIAAIGYAAFSINGVVIMWNLAPSAAVVGAYTGLYGVAASIGASLGPAAIGLLVDLTDWRYLMAWAAVLCVIGLVLMMIVRSEVNPSQFASESDDDLSSVEPSAAGQPAAGGAVAEDGPGAGH
ncbi:MAG: MFS transporter [Propionibacteriaceae bacterium]|nr:MFS transporter [Propionibacteriaceae bacterium]